MHLFLIIELAFIIFYSGAILKGFLKRHRLKKEGDFTIIRNYNVSFTVTLMALIIIVIIYIYYFDDNGILGTVLSLIIILLLISNILINSGILLSKNTLYYMYYNVNYNEIERVVVKNKGTDNLITFAFQRTSFYFSIDKPKTDKLISLLKDKNVKIEYNK